MTINSTLDRDKPPKDWMKTGFYAIAILVNLCLIAQLLKTRRDVRRYSW